MPDKQDLLCLDRKHGRTSVSTMRTHAQHGEDGTCISRCLREKRGSSRDVGGHEGTLPGFALGSEAY